MSIRDEKANFVKVNQKKYMTFVLGNESYCIDIIKIREIIGIIEITPIPRMPVFIKGVINLRGRIIPVIDLRMKIGFEQREYDSRTCTIIVDIDIQNQVSMIGLIVDRVLEVINITEDDLEPSPNFGLTIDTTFISGMAKVESQVIAILNTDKLLTERDVEIIQASNNEVKLEENIKNNEV